MLVSVVMIAVMILVFVLILEIVSEYLGVGHDLLQKLCIGNDRVVSLVQLRLVPKGGQQLLVRPREFVDVLPAAIIGR